ncbi:MAG: hypothetical protein HY815_23415, partial [Candidatus Riflebacteria bacterium]|nr:hypothetical protein [Candidatus Riflebacteria bacterium]
ALLWLAATHHVARTGEGLRLLPKARVTFEEIYVDTTDWSTLDYLSARNRDLVKALGKETVDAARESATRKLQELKEGLKDDLSKQAENFRKGLEHITTPPSPDR